MSTKKTDPRKEAEGKIDNEKLKKKLDKKRKKVKEEDVGKVLEKEEKLKRVLEKAPSALGKFVMQVKLLLGMLKDYWNKEYKEVPWSTIAAVVVALAYVISPVDLIPDVIPVIGLVDDALVVALTIALIREDLKRYCAFKGFDPEMYF